MPACGSTMSESPGDVTVLVGDIGGDSVVLVGDMGFVDCVVEAAPWVLPFARPVQPVATRAMIAMSPRTRSPRRSLDALEVLIFLRLTSTSD